MKPSIPRSGLCRTSRLRSPKDFQRVRRAGRRSAGACLVVERAPARTPGHSCLGLVVSRRVGGAVARNRVKRCVREWFRRSREDFPEAMDIVVIARARAAGQPCRALAGELAGLIRQ